MTAPLSVTAARFLDLLREGKPIDVPSARAHGVPSPVKAAAELLAAGHPVRAGIAGRKPGCVWSLVKPKPKPEERPKRKDGPPKSERVAAREAKIEALMADGAWRTIHEIGNGIGAQEHEIRIRDAVARFRARPEEFDVERRACTDKLSGHWEFRIVRRVVE